MPASSSPTVGDNVTDEPKADSPLRDCVLSIEMSGIKPQLETKFVVVHGNPPQELPYFHRFSHIAGDTRQLGRLTIRFVSKKANRLFDQARAQDDVRLTIWTTVRKLLSEGGFPLDLPTIAFDAVEKGGKMHSLVDLIFATNQAYYGVYRKLEALNIGSCVFERTCLTNSLPGDVFKLDCVNFHLDGGTNIESLYSAFTDMTSGIGSLLGIAKIVFTKAELVQDKYSGSLRLYVKLTRYWRAAPLEDLVASLPTFFKWHGVSHRLLYAGLDLHAKPAYSADYPLNTVGAASEPLTATSATQTPNESGGVSKKRKARGG